MANATLSASSRSETGKGAARKLRQSGNIPAVIYGHSREPQSLTINGREMDRLLRTTSVASTIVDLSIDGKSVRTLIREIQRHPYKRSIIHVDFQELVAGETVTVKCPLVYTGTPEGVRVEGGILDIVMHELTIEVDPSNIPGRIEVDITAVKLGRPMHVSDIKLPAGVTVLDDKGSTVCVVSAPRVSEAATETEETAAEPELIRKPKPDETA